MPNPDVLDNVVFEGIPLREWLRMLNKQIREFVGPGARNLQIGHSFFMPSGKTVNNFSTFARIVRDEIIPLLEEYCYDDYEVLSKLLGASLVDVSSLRIKYELFEEENNGKLISALLEASPGITTTPEAIMEAEEQPETEEDE
ncbi:MAG: hypothetical protein ACD_28C00098G0001 [uncultured bacterium]|nr:MAG: hypothetical protein ACD_28C00098G0001 [uncultured bacterium]